MKIKTVRRISQILTIALVVTIPLLNRKGIAAITGTLYSLAIGPVWITDPLSGFQVILSTLSANTALVLSMLIPLAVALVFGRIFCGWFCPQNAISEFVDYLSRKMSVLANKGSRGLWLLDPPPSARTRYIIMVALLILTPLLGFPVANLLSAPGILSVQTTKYLYEGAVGPELGLIGAIVLAELFLIRRVWCNHVCPVGSFLGLFRFRKTMKVVYSEGAERICGRCLDCVRACQLGLNPMGGKIYPLCHNCGDCIAACEKIKTDRKPLTFGF